MDSDSELLKDKETDGGIGGGVTNLLLSQNATPIRHPKIYVFGNGVSYGGAGTGSQTASWIV